MILKIAWKNIWRNPTRSLILIVAIAIGVWSLVFLMGWVQGIVDGYLDQAINHRLSHLQIHHPSFKEEQEVKYFFDGDKIREEMEQLYPRSSLTTRIIANAMISSARNNRAVTAVGVHPSVEAGVTDISAFVKEGVYLADEDDRGILLSADLADKLKVKLRSKVVLNFQNIDGDIVAASFRIKGLYETGDIKIDEFMAFVDDSSIRSLMGLPGNAVHEVAILTDDLGSVKSVRDTLKKSFANLDVETYNEISPEVELYSSQINVNMIVMTTIFMLALVFGIINTMLMAVLERVRELGMLMAIGMNKLRVFLMIIYETLMVSITGVPIGLLLGYLTIIWLSDKGIDLSNWSEGLRQFGISQIVKPELDGVYYLWIGIAVAITALIGSIYPSVKAIRLKPVEAMRKI